MTTPQWFTKPNDELTKEELQEAIEYEREMERLDTLHKEYSSRLITDITDNEV